MKPVKLVRRGMDEGKKETKGVTEKEKKKRKKYKKINAQRVPTESHHLQSCQPKDFQYQYLKEKEEPPTAIHHRKTRFSRERYGQ